MNRDYEQTEFSKSLLAGVFAGITATILSLVFNMYFRGLKDFTLPEIINVSTIIFMLILVVTVAGIVFYLFHHYFKRGTLLFQVTTIAVTLLLIAATMQVQRSSDPVLATDFRELLLGIVGITGACTVFIIPFLYKHDYI